MSTPRLVVLSSLFPSQVRPQAGVFIRERMFRVGKQIPIIVVSPVPWFPLQGLIRLVKPSYRPQPKPYELQDNIAVYYPRFLAFPGIGRSLDGFFMAVGCYRLLKKLKKTFDFNIIDAHFAYPDGYAATLLGQWFKVPVTITLRGTEVPLAKIPSRCMRMIQALKHARQVFAVAQSLKDHVIQLGAEGSKIEVVGNAVDTQIFYLVDQLSARQQLGITHSSPVFISVGGLVERKGFHRVLHILPELKKQYPQLLYLIVGGEGPEGGMLLQLKQQVLDLGLQANVMFLGALPTCELKIPLSAADVFVLATANEGWANVFLEAMACGLPIVTTDVGGNKEVVKSDEFGFIVPFGDERALFMSLSSAIEKQWDRQGIIRYAQENHWDKRVDILVNHFRRIADHYTD